MMKHTWRALREYQKALRDAEIRDKTKKKDFPSSINYSSVAEFAEKTRFLSKDVPFSFEDRKYLLDIYNDQSKEINIVKGRQTEITEFLLNWLLYNLIKNPGTVGLYMSDRQDHVSVFSKLRLQSRAIGLSPVLQSLVEPDHNISEQAFLNGSHLFMFSGWGEFEAARSIPADFTAVDEMQSMNWDALPVIKESMAHSEFGRMIKVGTGSDEGDGWYNEYTAGYQLEWNQELKKWIPKLDQKVKTDVGIHSYQISQKLVPLVCQNYELKKSTYTPRNFTTEVDGWFFKGLRKPLLAADIQALMDNNLDFTGAINVDHTLGPVYMGIDWGGGVQAYTVAWIWQLINADVPRFRLLYVKKYDKEEDRSTQVQADKVSQLIDIYEVDKIVMDAGGGPYQVERISERYAERAYKCHYLSRPEEPFEPISDGHKMNVDRTWIIETIIDLIRRPEKRDDFPHPIPRIVLPGAQERREEVEWIIDHFTCIEAETSNAMGRSRTIYTHPPDTNDDALMACCYAYLAFLLDKKKNVNWFRFG